MAKKKPLVCETCKHWKRNEGFPNRYGVCEREFIPTVHIFAHALIGAETHEKFGCTGHEHKEDSVVQSTNG